MGIIVATKMVEDLQEYKPGNDRIIYTSIRVVIQNLSITKVYVRTSKVSEVETEQFYQQLQEVVSENARRNVLLVTGDFNSTVRNQIFRSIKG